VPWLPKGRSLARAVEALPKKGRTAAPIEEPPVEVRATPRVGLEGRGVTYELRGNSLQDVTHTNGGVRPRLEIVERKIPIDQIVRTQPEVRASDLDGWRAVDPAKRPPIRVVEMWRIKTVETPDGPKQIREPVYGILDGHHRWMANVLDGLKMIDAKVYSRAAYEAGNYGLDFISNKVRPGTPEVVPEFFKRTGMMGGAKEKPLDVPRPPE
jgi:hypothetical protein